MHPGESSKKTAPPALSSGGSMDALPDGVLEHILGFLPAQEAVRTCVLARRWRYLWRSAPGLRVGWPGDGEQAPPPVKEHRELVDRLLLLRGGSPLDTCDIRLGEFQDDDVPRVNFWVWHAISCKILFKWDLRWCPVFSMLKTLVLNEYWCVPDDANLLLRILEHSPVLEELTLELFSEGPNYEVEMKGSINQMERSAKISEYLNIVKIKCQIVDESVLNVCLRTFDICFGF